MTSGVHSVPGDFPVVDLPNGEIDSPPSPPATDDGDFGDD